MPEAKLAREAEICYATVAMVTDFDCWHPDHDHVTVEAVVQVLLANADKRARPGEARGAGARAPPRACARPAATARSTTPIITATHMRDPAWWPGWTPSPGACWGAERGGQKGQGRRPGPPPGDKSPGPLSLWLGAGGGSLGSEWRGGRIAQRSMPNPPFGPDPPVPAPSQNGRVPRAVPLAGVQGAAPLAFFLPPNVARRGLARGVIWSNPRPFPLAPLEAGVSEYDWERTMATIVTIEAVARARAGRGAARATRREGKVPGVIYGAKQPQPDRARSARDPAGAAPAGLAVAGL